MKSSPLRWYSVLKVYLKNVYTRNYFKMRKILTGAKLLLISTYIKRWSENESKPIMNFRFLRIPSLISKDQKENIICTMDDVRGDF